MLQFGRLADASSLMSQIYFLPTWNLTPHEQITTAKKSDAANVKLVFQLLVKCKNLTPLLSSILNLQIPQLKANHPMATSEYNSFLNPIPAEILM